MKKTFLFLTALVMSAMMWAETVTSTFTDKNWNVGGGEEAWTAAGAAATALESSGSARGVQVTLVNIKNDGLTLTNTSIQSLGSISKVEIVYSSNCGGSTDGTIAVAVGATNFGDAFTIKKENNATISFENATPVAGDIVITFTSTATSKSVYVKSITVTYEGTPTPQKEIVSLAIDGTATKMTYFVGDAFDPAGLTVTATYSDATTGDVTSEVDWTISPETFTEASENASVNVTAKIGEIESAQFQVNGIVVTVKEVTYANTYTSNVELTDEGGTSASAAKVVIGGTEYDAIKAGTGKVHGACVVTISAATEVLHFHAAGWNGETVVLDVNGTEYTLVADAGVSNNSPFTLQNDPETQDYFTFDPQGATTITFTATSGFRFVLFGVNAELEQGVVAAPAFAPAATDFDGSVEVSLTCETEGADIFYAIGEEVTSMNAIPYTQPIVLTDTTTIYAVAKKDGKESEQVNKTYNLIPVFASLADLVANMPAGENAVKVKVTITSAAIDSFYVNKSGYRNGVYVTAANTAVELYEYNVPETWVVGGTVSSTIIAEWLSYNGTLELQKWEGGWDAFTYTAPDPTALQEIMINGNIRKLMHRGHIMILKGDKMFNLHGQLVK